MPLTTSGLAVLLTLLPSPGPAAAPTRGAASCRLAEHSSHRASRAVLRDLKRDLRDRQGDRRRRAVARLARLDVPEGWELVLTALRDSDPQVGDEAQLCLSAWEDSRGVLLGKEGLASRHEIVRLRVAESYGRRRERVDGGALARHLDPRDGRVARMLLWSLERLAREGLLAEMGRPALRRVAACLRANLDPLLRADALAALAHLDPSAARESLAELRQDRHAAVRCAALAATALLAESELDAACGEALSDEASAVRSEAIACLGRRADRAAVIRMADALEGESRPRLRIELVSALQRLTGRKYRDDARPWRQFAAGLPADWEPETTAPVAIDTERTAAFAGLPILSDRLCLLIDFSGSLWYERDDGRTPKDVVDRELRSALEALPEGTWFNVVPYTREPHPWRSELAENRGRVVADALRYFERCRETGPGSFYEAARFALSDERVDAVVVLTDGAPTGGEHWNLELLFDLLTHENRHRRVVFDTVLVGAGSGLVEKWSAFTERSGGRSIGVRIAEGEAVLRAR